MSFRDTLVGGSVFALFIYRICASEGEMAAGEKPDRARGRNGKGPVRRHEESRKHTTAHSFATRNCAPPPSPTPAPRFYFEDQTGWGDSLISVSDAIKITEN